MNELAIDVHDLRVAYGDHVAVDGADLTVARGELVALLGTNGAGKTSMLETIEATAAPTAAACACSGSTPAGSGWSCSAASGSCCRRAASRAS